jgi:hypothetical protein
MSLERKEPPKKPETTSTPPKKTVEQLKTETYVESARAVREVATRVLLSVGAAILIWVFGTIIFLPIAKGMSQQFLGYPVHSIVSFIIVVAMAFFVFTVFIDIRRLTRGMAGLMAYHFGKASGEIDVDNFDNYRNALDGILYIFVVSLAYLLFANYLAEIHPAIPAILLILIVIWAIFALWRSVKAITKIVGRQTSEWADELEKQAKKA